MSLQRFPTAILWDFYNFPIGFLKNVRQFFAFNKPHLFCEEKGSFTSPHNVNVDCDFNRNDKK